MLITCENISKSYTDKVLLDNQTITVSSTDKIGIIGVNGCGKSTLLKIMAKIEDPDSGEVTYEKFKKITYLSQELNLDENNTPLQQVLLSFSTKEKEEKEYEAKSILSKLGVNEIDKPIKYLSGGEKRKVSIASSLIKESDCLLIDEITNHLDSETITFLEKYLIKFNKAIVMVTHDRYFLERITNRIIEIYKGKLYYYEGSYSRFLELKAQRMEYAIAAERKRQAFLRREYEWIKRGALARTTKSKKRIENYYDVANNNIDIYDKTIEISSISSRLGRKTIEVNNISKIYDNKIIINNFSFLLDNDARIGIIGKNGIGKTTLLKVITGLIPPTTGTVEIGETVKIGYFSQENENLPNNKRVYDFLKEIGEVIETTEGTLSITQILDKFLFFKESQYAFISNLSGGEKRRLYLLSVLLQKPNILVLDEPTNDLDIDTLEVLEDYLEQFKGAVIIVSHDRYFLDKTVDNILYLKDNGIIERYNGNYTEFSNKLKVEEKNKEEKKTNKINLNPKPVKMTFNEKKEFSTIMDDISNIEEQIKNLDEKINISYMNYSLVKDEMDKKKILEDELNKKLERWEYLSELDEQSKK